MAMLWNCAFRDFAKFGDFDTVKWPLDESCLEGVGVRIVCIVAVCRIGRRRWLSRGYRSSQCGSPGHHSQSECSARRIGERVKCTERSKLRWRGGRARYDSSRHDDHDAELAAI